MILINIFPVNFFVVLWYNIRVIISAKACLLAGRADPPLAENLKIMIILEPIKKKINEMMRLLIINGIILVLLAVLITWNVQLMQLILALIVLIVAYSFFYAAYKLWTLKKLL